MPAHHPDRDPAELPTIETADLSTVTGGAGFDMASMLPMMMMMMMRRRSQAAAPVAAAPAPAAPRWTPQITVDGVVQNLAPSADGSFTATSTTSTTDG